MAEYIEHQVGDSSCCCSSCLNNYLNQGIVPQNVQDRLNNIQRFENIFLQLEPASLSPTSEEIRKGFADAQAIFEYSDNSMIENHITRCMADQDRPEIWPFIYKFLRGEETISQIMFILQQMAHDTVPQYDGCEIWEPMEHDPTWGLPDENELTACYLIAAKGYFQRKL
jgi:hypothetical protein